MADPNEICRICKEPRSTHIETPNGKLTHRREALGEGTYRLVRNGSYNGGLMCYACGGNVCDGHPYEDYEFMPTFPAHIEAL